MSNTWHCLQEKFMSNTYYGMQVWFCSKIVLCSNSREFFAVLSLTRKNINIYIYIYNNQYKYVPSKHNFILKGYEQLHVSAASCTHQQAEHNQNKDEYCTSIYNFSLFSLQMAALARWYIQMFLNILYKVTFTRNPIISFIVPLQTAHPGGRAVYGIGLRPLAYWDCGIESRRRQGCLSLVSVVCCQVEVSASGWSPVQRTPIECNVSEYDQVQQ